MKYIKPFHFIAENLSDQKDKIIKSIYKCLDILSEYAPDNVKYNFADEDLEQHNIQIDNISNILELDFFYTFRKLNDSSWLIDNNEAEELLEFSEFDTPDLYSILKYLIAIPEVSQVVNKEAYINLNK